MKRAIIFTLLISLILTACTSEATTSSILGGLTEGLVGAAFGGLVAWIISRRERQKKQLSYEILAATPLFSVSEKASDDIQVLYKQNPIDNLFLYQIKFTNTGNQALSPDEFKLDLASEHEGDNLSFLGGDIINTPSSSAMSLQVMHPQDSPLQFIISGILLNPKDNFTVEYYISGNPSLPTINGFILNGKIIPYSPPRSIPFIIFLISLLWFVAGIYFFIKDPTNEVLLILTIIPLGKSVV